jgi:hypothetical protein
MPGVRAPRLRARVLSYLVDINDLAWAVVLSGERVGDGHRCLVDPRNNMSCAAELCQDGTAALSARVISCVIPCPADHAKSAGGKVKDPQRWVMRSVQRPASPLLAWFSWLTLPSRSASSLVAPLIVSRQASYLVL